MSDNLKVDEYEKIKEANRLINHINQIRENNIPEYLEPYKILLKNLANKKDANGFYFFETADTALLLKNISKKEFKRLSKEFEKLPNKSANVIEFVEIFLKSCYITAEKSNAKLLMQNHNHMQQDPILLNRLKLVIGLLDLFEEIKKKSNKSFIDWDNINKAILNSYIESSERSEFEIAHKLENNNEQLLGRVSPQMLSSLRPEIVGKIETNVKVFKPKHKISDNLSHPNGIRLYCIIIKIK